MGTGALLRLRPKHSRLGCAEQPLRRSRDVRFGLAWALATLIVVTLLTIGSLTVAAAAPATTISPEAAEAARKAGAAFAFYSSLSLLIGAFIASVAGALGGYHRDEV